MGRIERDQDARIKAAAIAMLESAGVPVQDEEEEEEAEEEEEEVDPTKLVSKNFCCGVAGCSID